MGTIAENVIENFDETLSKLKKEYKDKYDRQSLPYLIRKLFPDYKKEPSIQEKMQDYLYSLISETNRKLSENNIFLTEDFFREKYLKKVSYQFIVSEIHEDLYIESFREIFESELRKIG